MDILALPIPPKRWSHWSRDVLTWNYLPLIFGDGAKTAAKAAVAFLLRGRSTLNWEQPRGTGLALPTIFTNTVPLLSEFAPAVVRLYGAPTGECVVDRALQRSNTIGPVIDICEPRIPDAVIGEARGHQPRSVTGSLEIEMVRQQDA